MLVFGQENPGGIAKDGAAQKIRNQRRTKHRGATVGKQSQLYYLMLQCLHILGGREERRKDRKKLTVQERATAIGMFTFVCIGH